MTNTPPTPQSQQIEILTKCVSQHLIIAQEPYVYTGAIAGTPQRWAKWSSKNKKAVILDPISLSPVVLTPKENGIAIKINLNKKPCTIVSAYSSPLEEVENTLQDLQEYINYINNEDFIIGADLNGQHHNWGYSYTSPRGRAIDNLIGSCRATLLNTEDAPPSFIIQMAQWEGQICPFPAHQ
ncbi:hypothetical protein AVEN_80816-1 [Araneus ventricosus]|uniref:Endonuclease/exonuclease/phosphatase domain-containing protein n=1 Tax=Araneus ventricosus TaxID=182803 RepID=A0A4Y2NYH1_ARAVE|nr:hypothetical protein AVEN_80816-1 [Araneus ventricosus]